MSLSLAMHEQTEKVSQLLSVGELDVIAHRYQFCAEIIKDNTSILEVGVGHGVSVEYFSAHGKLYVACDYSNENIEFLRLNFEHNHIVQLDANNLPFASDSFDVVLAMAMIYYLDFYKFVESSKRVLRDGGSLIFCSSNKNVPGFVPAPSTVQYCSIPEMNKTLSNYGFSCQFWGAFPATGGPLVIRYIKAVMRNCLKAVIRLIPGGEKFWKKKRQAYFGPRQPLPRTFDQIELTNDHKAIKLNPNKINRYYRVIYCEAIKG